MSCLCEANCWYSASYTQLVYKVFSYFEREGDAGMPVRDVAKVQECTDEACNINIRSVQKSISKGNIAICISLSACHLLSFMLVSLAVTCL
jgi:hypothetical protein